MEKRRSSTENRQDLFTRIIEWLSSPDGEKETLGKILNEVCQRYNFGCGFIYEADHTKTFYLKESYACYEVKSMLQAFRVEATLTESEIRRLIKASVIFQNMGDDESGRGQTKIFDSKTYMIVPVLDADNSLIGLVGMLDRRRNSFLDASVVTATKTVLNLLANHVKLRLYRRNLEYAQQSMASMLDNAGIDIYVTDFDTYDILYVNKSMGAPYGGREKMLGRKCWKTLYPDKTGPCDYCPKQKLIDAAGNPTKVYLWDYQRPFDSSWFRVLSAAFTWFDGRLAHVISSVDITENKLSEAKIARLANFDALTDLPNRRKLVLDCDASIQAAQTKSAAGYVLFFDLDNFKPLNDSLGHRAGDELLVQVGKMLRDSPLTGNHGYRFGGDEFVLLFNQAEKEQIVETINFLLTRFEEPWPVNGSSPICRASIGVAKFPEQGATASEILHHADMMMYKAKRLGRGMACFYDGETIAPPRLESHPNSPHPV